jgi:hypothetical protein
MRVGIVFFYDKNRDKLLQISKGLAQGIESQGHHVDLIDGKQDVNTKLTIYGYIAVGTEATSTFGGSIPEGVNNFLGNAGMVTGKRSFAFILKSGLRKTKTLFKLMQAMEHEGMFLKTSEIITSAEEAQEIGIKLHISK